MTFGFIVLRHVNSTETNKYWNQCVKLLRIHYPTNNIVVIDDNSNYDYVRADFEYKNIIFVQSEYPKRGELLPYIYYLRHPWFDNAVIIHDSTFIHKPYPFGEIRQSVIPLWNFNYDKENYPNLLRISQRLKNKHSVFKKLKDNNQIMRLNIPITGCFGLQTFINHKFLVKLNRTFDIHRLIPVIRCRVDRCGLERVMAAMFHVEYPEIYRMSSIFGNISNHPKSFSYPFSEYEQDFEKNKLPQGIVKVWTGR